MSVDGGIWWLVRSKCGAGPDGLKHLMCFTGEIVKPQKKTDGASCNSESKAPGYWLNSKYNSILKAQVYVYKHFNAGVIEHE